MAHRGKNQGKSLIQNPQVPIPFNFLKNFAQIYLLWCDSTTANYFIYLFIYFISLLSQMGYTISPNSWCSMSTQNMAENIQAVIRSRWFCSNCRFISLATCHCCCVNTQDLNGNAFIVCGQGLKKWVTTHEHDLYTNYHLSPLVSKAYWHNSLSDLLWISSN